MFCGRSVAIAHIRKPTYDQQIIFMKSVVFIMFNRPEPIMLLELPIMLLSIIP